MQTSGCKFVYIFPSFLTLLRNFLSALFKQNGAPRGVCGKKTNCETVTCSQGKLADGLFLPLLASAQSVPTEFTWQISVLNQPATSKPAATGSRCCHSCPLSGFGSLQHACQKTSLQIPTFSSSLLHKYPFLSSHTMSLLLPSFYTLCLWVPSSERRYIKHMLASHNLNFPLLSLSWRGLFHKCSVLLWGPPGCGTADLLGRACCQVFTVRERRRAEGRAQSGTVPSDTLPALAWASVYWREGKRLTAIVRLK